MSDSQVTSVGPCQSLQERHGQIHVQEEGQDLSQHMMCDLERETSPLLCRLRMNFRDQELSNKFSARLQMCSYCYQAGGC